MSGSPRPGFWVSEPVSRRWLPSRLLPEASLAVPPTLQPVPRRGPSSPCPGARPREALLGFADVHPRTSGMLDFAHASYEMTCRDRQKHTRDAGAILPAKHSLLSASQPRGVSLWWCLTPCDPMD